jgi:quercetin 2,3-dioxygenase
MSTFETVHEPCVTRVDAFGRGVPARRLLPHRGRRMIGGWCLLDLFGAPDGRDGAVRMWLPPHPHAGVQTLTWLFDGSVVHADSLGAEQLVRAGELSLMTATDGVCHAELSPADAATGPHGVQLWAALPDHARSGTPSHYHHLTEVPTYREAGVTLRVLVGSLAGEVSPAIAFSPLVGAEVTLTPGSTATIPLEGDFEHGLLLVRGRLLADGKPVPPRALAHIARGRDSVELTAAEDAEARTVVMLLGGEPFEEDLLIWWNFVARSHEEIVALREAWNGEGPAWFSPRFGEVKGFEGDRVPAPPVPPVRLRPGRHAGRGK